MTRDGQGPASPKVIVNGVGATPFPGGSAYFADASSAFLAGNFAGAGHATVLYAANNGLMRWEMDLGNGDPEAGGNSGSNFGIYRYTDAGALVDGPLLIDRASGTVTIANLNVLGGITAPISATNIVASGTLAIGSTSTFTGVATFNAPNGVQMSVPAGQNAEYLCIVAGQRQWGVGEYSTGYFRIVDYTAGLERLSIDSTGLFTVNGKVVANGISFGSVVAAGGALDLSRHIALWGTSYGFSITGGTLNIVSSGAAIMALTNSGATVAGTFVSTGNMTCNSNFNTNQINGTVIIASQYLQVAAGAASALLYLGTNARQWSIWSNIGDGFLYFYDNSAGALRMYINTAGAVICNGNLTCSGNFNTNAISCAGITCTTINTQGNHADLGNINVAANGVAYNRLNSGRYFEFSSSGTSLTFYVNGTVGGVWGFNPSDERIKKNIGPATGDALGELRSVRLISFDYDEPSMRDPKFQPLHLSYGFSAQQLQTVIPEAVNKVETKAQPEADDELMLTLDIMPLLARCVGAIQQMAKRIETLEARP